ncbi:glycosyltransferase family 4 protein [Marinomonas sp. PE14-40]|uniref:glycosyltransferase family 4 protein n=1 Tax=Marinomonas sp. PE14-40 TaxID=3060621 RepID=UPI003F67F3BA
MRIAILSDDYLPHSTLVHAKMLHELAVDLKTKGNDVVVITPGLFNKKAKLLIDEIDGVTIWKFHSGQTHGASKIKRAINESLFSPRALLAIKSELNKEKFDLCINYSPTIFFGYLARYLRKNYNTYIYLILRDMFPQWVIDEGMISGRSIIAKYFRFFEKLNYDASNSIGLMSEANVVYFKSIYSGYDNLKVLPNWAAIKPFQVEKYTLNIRKKLSLHDKVIFFYGGNIGHAQDMGNLIRLAERLKGVENAHFLFIGQGDEFNLVEKRIHELSLNNLTLLPSINQDQYKEVLSQVDVGLFSLAKSHKAHNFPGKLLGYMVQSLPILGSVNDGNDLIEFVNKKNAGFAYVNGEDEKLYQSALELLNNSCLRKSIGENAFQLLNDHFSVDTASKNILYEVNAFSRDL